MRISVFGCGYLGAVHAAAMASLGHDVVGVDPDASKVGMLASGRPPFYEPDFAELLASSVAGGRLRFTADPAEAASAEVHFIAVGTPQRDDGGAELSYLEEAVATIAATLAPGSLVVGKSTVPVGTAAVLADRIEEAGGRLMWNPEFLREGFAVQDTLRPDRVVYGVRDGDDAEAVAMLDAVYAGVLSQGMPRIVTDLATAELVKVAANAFLATKISFINAMAEVAEVVGADVTQLADALGTMRASVAASSTRVSDSAAAACRRTSEPFGLARRSSGSETPSRSSVRSTASTSAVVTGSCSSRPRCSEARWPVGASRCSASRSSPTPMMSATRPRSRSPAASSRQGLG